MPADAIHRFVFAPLALVLLLAGCAGPASVRDGGTRGWSGARTAVERPATTAPPESNTADALFSEIESWLGTPYRYGGDSRSGIDCSAFVQRVYRDALGVSLPRVTRQQRDVGREVGGDLAVADLVFFFTPVKTDHVGVFLGDGRFAHASTSQGVTISRLDDAYWRNAFVQARRVELPR